MNILLDLFLTFARIGGLTFGGGYAMLPILQRDVAETKKWTTEEELMDYYAIGQCTPGIISVNVATFIGYKKAGFLGALVATLGIVVPSFIVIFLISMFLDNFLEITIVANAFKGIKVGVGLLILDAAITMINKMQKKEIVKTNYDMFVCYNVMYQCFCLEFFIY